MAGVTLLGAVQVELLLAAEGGLLKGDGEAGPQALSLLGAIAPASGGPEAPSAEAAEEGAEQVAQVNVSKVSSEAAPASAVVGVHPGVAKLVIPGPLLLVGQDLVGLVDLFEPGLRFFVPRVHIRVVFFG